MLFQTTLDALRELPLTRFETDSRKITPGNIFVCTTGLNCDGHSFVDDAISRGAIGCIASRPLNTRLPCFIMPGKAMMTALISRYYEYPQRQLFNIGVTGTNGKTTVAYSLYRLLGRLGRPAYTGTLGCEFQGSREPLVNTTPDTVTLLNYMHRMVSSGIRQHIMEVSSHALDQGRVDFMDYDIVVFTNFGKDHLDYHGRQDDYIQAKLRLSDRLKPQGLAIVNLDDPMAMAVIDGCRFRGNLITYSIQDPAADLYATRIQASCKGARFSLSYRQKEYEVQTGHPFLFNVENTLAVAACLLGMGHAPDRVMPLLTTMPMVPGRCEVIPFSNGSTAIVDYAHNFNALTNLIKQVRRNTTGSVYTLLGVPGDRLSDAENIGHYCSVWSDHSYFTTDNPMGIRPEKILRTMSVRAAGDKISLEVCRERAIAKALKRLAGKPNCDDVLLVCGKGPETWQYMSSDKQKGEPYAGDKELVMAGAGKAGLTKLKTS